MEHSSYIKFAEKIRGKKYGRGKLHKMFLQEVEKGDYLRSEEEEIIDTLTEVANDDGVVGCL
jgi:hypothetical protein